MNDEQVMKSAKVGSFQVIDKPTECNICKKHSDKTYQDVVYVGAYAISRDMCKECAKARGYKLK